MQSFEENRHASSAAQETLASCWNTLEGPPKPDVSRVYVGRATMRWKSFGKNKRTTKRVCYEIGNRFDVGGRRPSGSGFGDKLRSKLVRPLDSDQVLPRVRVVTAADYVEKLCRVAQKHTARPNWAYFDFAAMVHIMAAWLAACTWDPKLRLADLAQYDKLGLSVIATIDDVNALANSSLFISQSVSGVSGNHIFWVLVAAAHCAGAMVVTDRVMLANQTCARLMSCDGPYLWNSLVNALSLLAELYDRSGAGEIFAQAFTRGIHSVNTVTAHSDEGGFMRDILREGSYPPPFGGLPPDCPFSAGLPSLSREAPYSGLCHIVDSYTLRTAAATAHCYPLVEVDTGVWRPAVFVGTLPKHAMIGEEPLPPPAKASEAEKANYEVTMQMIRQDRAEHVSKIRGPVLDAVSEFCRWYCPALSRLFGFNATDTVYHDARYWLQDSAAGVLAEPDNRHLIKGDVFAPFYWIEPTTLIPKDFFGTPAEAEGWASYGAGTQQLRTRWFEDVYAINNRGDRDRSYNIKFEGARKAHWIAALHMLREDGLAQAHFQSWDGNSVALAGGAAAADGMRVAWEKRYSVDKYLWTRGQSPFPHPCELLYTDVRAVLNVHHFHASSDDWWSAFPSFNEMQDAMIDWSFDVVEAVEPRLACDLPRRDRAERTAGLRALEEVSMRRAADGRRPVIAGGYRWGMVAHPLARSNFSSVTRPPDLDDRYGANAATATTAIVAGQDRNRGREQKLRGAPLDAVYASGTHTGPRVPQTTATGPTPGAVASCPSQAPPAISPAGATNESDGHAAAGVAPQAQ